MIELHARMTFHFTVRNSAFRRAKHYLAEAKSWESPIMPPKTHSRDLILPFDTTRRFLGPFESL
jgi:hypothetical protein